MFKSIREYENMHITLWLLKDSCWVMNFKLAGMVMIVPTILVAIHIAWISRKNMADLFHNIAVCLWICANATWMTGEFFFNDGLRTYAAIFFGLGLAVVAAYYLIHLPRNTPNTTE